VQTRGVTFSKAVASPRPSCAICGVRWFAVSFFSVSLCFVAFLISSPRSSRTLCAPSYWRCTFFSQILPISPPFPKNVVADLYPSTELLSFFWIPYIGVVGLMCLGWRRNRSTAFLPSVPSLSPKVLTLFFRDLVHQIRSIVGNEGKFFGFSRWSRAVAPFRPQADFLQERVFSLPSPDRRGGDLAPHRIPLPFPFPEGKESNFVLELDELTCPFMAGSFSIAKQRRPFFLPCCSVDVPYQSTVAGTVIFGRFKRFLVRLEPLSHDSSLPRILSNTR